MKIEKLKPGQIVYDVHRHKMGNTTLTSMGVWNVRIVEVNIEKQTVLASWNCNQEQTYYRGTWGKWRANKPVLVKVGWAQRLATRAELKALKEGKQ